MGINRYFKGVWIPKEIWLNKDLTVMEKLFLVEIDSLDNDKGCFASNAHFAEFFGITKGRCTQIIKSLEKKGLVTIKLERDGKNISKRIIKVVRKLNALVSKLNTPISETKYPYLENDGDSNTSNSNTVSNTVSDMSSNSTRAPYKEIIEYLNEKTGRHYKHTAKANQKVIKARINEGYTLEEFKTVIDKKTTEWKDDVKMNEYLRPETLFSTKFDRYLNESLENLDEIPGLPTGSYDPLADVRDLEI